MAWVIFLLELVLLSCGVGAGCGIYLELARRGVKFISRRPVFSSRSARLPRTSTLPRTLSFQHRPPQYKSLSNCYPGFELITCSS
jgi:hypothetical protein